MKRIAFAAFFFVLVSLIFLQTLSFSLHAATPIRTLDAVVTRVIDGDTVVTETSNGTRLKVRLYGIDAPELARAGKPGQPFAPESTSYLSSLVLGKTVRLDIWAIDRYRRMVAMIWLDGRNVNKAMISAGMAEAYVEYLKHEPNRSQFLKAERKAKEKKVGIWSLGRKYERPTAYKNRLAKTDKKS